MAYCLRSFVQTLNEVLHPEQHHKKWVLDHDKIPQIQSLFENATFLTDFLDNSSPIFQERIASLEDQIMEAAEKAEDTLELYITSLLVSNQAFTLSPPDLEEAFQAFEVAKQEVIKIMDENVPLPVSSTRYPSSGNVVVGVTEDLNQLKSRLTSRATELDIIPIVGMGGIGKTTLARILYDNFSSSKSHFDCCAWVTVSQTYDPQQILNTLLACMNEKTQLKTNTDLVVKMHKALFGRRYLIVLDDIWSCEAWDDVQRAFPQDNKGSRIILTTRENIVGDYVNSKCHEMHFINEDDSWELLRGIVFGEESCPRVLEEVGKSIARSCAGLPLALQVISGLLSQSQKSLDLWKNVAYNVSSLIAKTDDQFSGIFDWSFAQLPHYLKPCFLYMAGFPEDYAIPASRIIRLWVAEGFLHPIRGKSFEEAAKIHLNALVDRNLIFVRGRGKSGGAKSFSIHDLLRDLCSRKAQEKKFLFVSDNRQKKDVLFLGRNVSVVGMNYPSILMPLTRSVRSYLNSDAIILSCLCFNLSLLRVLDLGTILFGEFPGVILQLVNLRYLDIYTMECLSVSISVLRNLQTLIISKISSLAMISDMPQLRHIKIMFSGMAEYSELPYGLYENLQSLSAIPAKELRKLLGKLPNLRKLTIDFYHGDFIDLTCFHNLASLNCRSEYGNLFGFSYNMTFPVSLKKLSLTGCKIGQSLLDAIGALPNLQILEISTSHSKMDWEPSEDGFCELKYLEINDWKLANWLATEIHFPVLEHLVLKKCSYLTEIPNDFGAIETLKIIEVDGCLPSVFDSARRIYDEQCQFGNTLLQLRLGDDIVEEAET